MSIESVILGLAMVQLLIATAALCFAEMTYSRLSARLNEIEERVKNMGMGEAPNEHKSR